MLGSLTIYFRSETTRLHTAVSEATRGREAAESDLITCRSDMSKLQEIHATAMSRVQAEAKDATSCLSQKASSLEAHVVELQHDLEVLRY